MALSHGFNLYLLMANATGHLSMFIGHVKVSIQLYCTEALCLYILVLWVLYVLCIHTFVGYMYFKYLLSLCELPFHSLKNSSNKQKHSFQCSPTYHHVSSLGIVFKKSLVSPRLLKIYS